MENGFAVSGSNMLFKVWGIITYVFAGIEALLGIIVMIGICAGAGYVPMYFSDVRGALIGTAIGIFIGAGIRVTLMVITGNLLVRDYVKSKGALVGFAVWQFVCVFFMLIYIIAGIYWGSAVVIIISFFGLAWNIATGIMLLLKRSRAIPWGRKKLIYESRGYAVLEGLYGGFQGKQYRLEVGQMCKIGRESTCDIQLFHPKISRLHCTVTLLENGNLVITDYSANGTFYGNRQMPNGEAIEVRPGDKLVVGEADNVIQLNTYF